VEQVCEIYYLLYDTKMTQIWRVTRALYKFSYLNLLKITAHSLIYMVALTSAILLYLTLNPIMKIVS